MRILFLSDFAYNKDGKFAGTERFVFGLAEWLNKNSNIKVDILTPDWKKENKSHLRKEVVNGANIYLFSTHDIHKHNPINSLRRIKGYYNAGANLREKYDCYHGFSTIAAITAAILLAKRKKTKSVTTIFIRDNIEAKLNLLTRLILFWILKKSDYITHNFWVNEKYFRDKYGFTKNIETIPVWIDLHIKPRKTKKEKKRTILFVGRMVEGKGVFVLLDAFAKLKQKINNIKLVFVGPEYEKERTLKKIKELHLESHVELKGFVSESKLAEWYNKSEMIVAPTIMNEGWTWTALEAMASGKPSIVTEELEIPGVKKQFQIVVRKNDDKELADAMEKILKNKRFSNELGKNSLTVIKKYFNKEKIMKQYLGVYGKVCNKK